MLGGVGWPLGRVLWPLSASSAGKQGCGPCPAWPFNYRASGWSQRWGTPQAQGVRMGLKESALGIGHLGC